MFSSFVLQAPDMDFTIYAISGRESASLNYPRSLRLSFFLSPTSVYLTMVGVEGYFSFDHTQGHTTVRRTPLDEGSARRREEAGLRSEFCW